MGKLEDVDRYGKRCRGKAELMKYLEGKPLTTKQSIAAKCYDCMGYGETDVNGSRDCTVSDCALYPYMPYNKGKRVRKLNISDERRKAMSDRMKKTAKAAMVLLMLSIPSIPCAQTSSTNEWIISPRMNNYNQPFGSAGSASNPYVVKERYDGNLEIRTRSQDFNRDLMAPGQPTNPYIMRPR